MTSFWTNTALPVGERFQFPIEDIGRMIGRKRAEQTADILRRWFREELGIECPKADEDIVTVAHGLGYSAVRLVPPTGDTETLALLCNGKTIRSIGVANPFATSGLGKVAK